ncbi:hypothetical protein LEP1GSC050_3582 [Leptospira broomii serovar Hurstbridge str. 5399]|uniref:Uncharacterized protein n=1 Tax=Leptospira broomii serovar Hurstbridge str. 5399 TaxID=1049789 RepID=T0GET4_9LEPT|nr:hypothetical protein LEP1GSC050_3582 [Leptospira broomii serovar Hurstbridge str. 5399]
MTKDCAVHNNFTTEFYGMAHLRKQVMKKENGKSWNPNCKGM